MSEAERKMTYSEWLKSRGERNPNDELLQKARDCIEESNLRHKSLLDECARYFGKCIMAHTRQTKSPDHSGGNGTAKGSLVPA